MRSKIMLLALVGGATLILVLAWFGYQSFTTGFSAKAEPHALEVFMARGLWHLAIPVGQRTTPNPVSLRPEVLAKARTHLACSLCHLPCQ